MLSAVTSLWCVSFVICHCAWATKLASPLGTTTNQPNIYQIKQGDQHVMYHYINDPENKVETESFAENKTLPHWTQWNWLPYIAALFVGIWAQCSSRATAIMETAGCWNQRTSWPVVENAFPEQFFGTLITASDWLIRRDFTVVILQTAALSTAWMLQEAASVPTPLKQGSCQEPHCSYHLQNCSSAAPLPTTTTTMPAPRHIKEQETEHVLLRHCKCATNLLATTAGVIERVHWRTGCMNVMALTTWLKKKEAYKRRWCYGCGSTEWCCTGSNKGKSLPSVFPEMPR